jgi:hypothetical protein
MVCRKRNATGQPTVIEPRNADNDFLHFMKIPAALKLPAMVLAMTVVLTVSTAFAQDNTTVAGTQVSGPAPVHLDYATAEVAKLTQAKVNDDTIIAYINSSGNLFNLNADQIIYLKQLGASDNVIRAMLTHPMRSLNTAVASSGGSTASYSTGGSTYVPTPSTPAPVVTQPVTYADTQPDTSYDPGSYYYPSSYYYPYYSSYPYYYGYGYPVSFWYGWGGRWGGWGGWRGGGWRGAPIGIWHGGGGFRGGGGGGFRGGHR